MIRTERNGGKVRDPIVYVFGFPPRSFDNGLGHDIKDFVTMVLEADFVGRLLNAWLSGSAAR